MIYYIFIYFFISIKNIEIPLEIINNIPYVNINFTDSFNDEEILNFVLETSISKTLINNINNEFFEKIINSSNYCNDIPSFGTLYGTFDISLYSNENNFIINDNDNDKIVQNFNFNNFSNDSIPYEFILGLSYESEFMNNLKGNNIINDKTICINTKNNLLKFESCSNELKKYKFEFEQKDDHIKIKDFIYIEINNNKITYTNNYALLSTSTYNIEIPKEVYEKYLKNSLNLNNDDCINIENIKIDKIILNIDKYNIEFKENELYYFDEVKKCNRFLFTYNKYTNLYRFGYGFIKKFDEFEINYDKKNIIIFSDKNFSKIHDYSITFIISILAIFLVFFIILFYLCLLQKCKKNNNNENIEDLPLETSINSLNN